MSFLAAYLKLPFHELTCQATSRRESRGKNELADKIAIRGERIEPPFAIWLAQDERSSFSTIACENAGQSFQ